MRRVMVYETIIHSASNIGRLHSPHYQCLVRQWMYRIVQRTPEDLEVGTGLKRRKYDLVGTGFSLPLVESRCEHNSYFICKKPKSVSYFVIIIMYL